MEDWIEQLERLAALHRSGALTNDEYEVQKTLLLQKRTPRPIVSTSGPSVVVQERRSGSYLFFGLVAAAICIGAYLGWSALREEQTTVADRALVAAAGEAVVSDTADPAPAPPPIEPVSLEASLKFRSPAECIADGTLEKVYQKLDKAMDSGASGITVKLDEFPKTFAVTAKRKTDADGMITTEGFVRFPDQTTWNGLRISRIISQRYLPPESDSTYVRQVTFLEPPEKVRRTLGRLGFGAPVGPDYSELPDTYNSCGGSMQLEAISGGTSLSCGWGC